MGLHSRLNFDPKGHTISWLLDLFSGNRSGRANFQIFSWKKNIFLEKKHFLWNFLYKRGAVGLLFISYATPKWFLDLWIFTFRKAYERTKFLYMYKTFTVPWIFLSGTPYERKFFLYFQSCRSVRVGIFFIIINFLEGQQNTYEWNLVTRVFRTV